MNAEGGNELVRANLPSESGNYKIVAFDSGRSEMPHLAVISDKTDFGGVVDIRIHSECLTGDVFGSRRCDCGDQLHAAMKHISEHGGVVVYLRQEGRGIGLVNKLKAYNLQDEGMDTAEANIALGFHVDERDFTPAVKILNSLKIKKVRVLTNNPDKFDVLTSSGIEVVERIALTTPRHSENEFYLNTKKNVFGHWL